MTHAPRRLTGSLLVLALAAACDAQPPVFVEVSTVSDTNLEDGPYEVRATVRDENGVARARLFWTVDALSHVEEMPLLVDDAKGALPFLDGALVERPRFRGEIPGQKIGTEVRWGVEACDTRGNCAVAPPAYPVHAYSFVVGLEPSSPGLTRVAPDAGPATGGTRVTLDGSDLRPGVIVTFGDAPATHVEWIRTDRVVVEAPAHDVGTVDVTVTNPDGETAALADAFTYAPAPVLLELSPTSGPTAGGTVVTLVGTSFIEGTSAFFDGVRCVNAVRFDDTRLACETPPGRSGLVDVDVRDESGARSVLPGAFTYVPPPVVDGVAPDRGPDLGGTVIEVRGTGFTDDTLVFVGTTPCATLEHVSDTLLVCTTAPGEAGIVDVTVVNPDGQSSTLVGGFNFLGPPVVALVIPDEGPRLGGYTARILGAGFSELMSVRFGGVPAELLDVIDDVELEVVVPESALPLAPAPLSGLALVDVAVTNLEVGDGRTGTREDAFAYFWPPEIDEVIPGAGPISGGTPVTIVGRFFREIEGQDFVVLIGELECLDVTIVSSTVIECVVPPGDEGFVDVVVQNHPDSMGIRVQGYEYIAPPEIIAVVPATGPTFGGERVRIIGRHFLPGMLVEFDGLFCTDVTYISATEVECTTPAHPAGFVDVRVVNPDGQEDTGPALYEYLPVVVIPDFGLEAGFTRVRVLASGMEPGVTVRFGGVLGVSCARQSSTEVICQTPPASSPGPVTVSFLNPNGTGDAADMGFTYKRFVDATFGRLDGLGLEANDVRVADLDLDGDLDLVVANGGNGDVAAQDDHLHRNDGAATFTRTVLPESTLRSHSVDFGDLNGDARPDLVIGHSGDGGATLYTNGLTATGGAFTKVPTPTPSFGTTTGAFDAQIVQLVGDAREDLLVLTIGCSNDFENPENCQDVNFGRDGLHERTGNTPSWTDRSSLIPHELGYVHDHKIAATDVDGDGWNDLVLFVDNFNFGAVGNEHRVLLNRTATGQGFVEDFSPFAGLVGDVFGVDVGDIDGDGDEDVIGGGCRPPFESSEIVYTNEGGTLVRNFSALPIAVDDCNFGVRLFDVDLDGDLDLAFSGSRDFQFLMKMYVNTGNGTFVESPLSVPAFDVTVIDTEGTGAASGDLDGDGDPDLVLSATGNGLAGALVLLLLD